VILDALTYPFRRNNLIFLATGTAFFSVPPVVAMLLPSVPYVGIIAMSIDGFVLCYALVYFQSVMVASTKADAPAPMWPEVTHWQDLVGSALHVMVPVVLSFLPLIALLVGWVFKHGTWELSSGALWSAVALFVMGFLYLPMALLVFTFHGETAVLNVIDIARSIGRIGREYFAVSGLLLAMFTVHGFLAERVARLSAVPAVPLASLLTFYSVMAAMRAVGALYARHRATLGWEDDTKDVSRAAGEEPTRPP
jgi:hypothetical protein